MTKLIAFIMPILLLGDYALSVQQGATTQAQVEISAAKKIERVLKLKEPKFKLTPRGTGSEAVKQQWQSGKEIATVNISETASAEEAAQYLQLSINSVSMGIITELKNIGDKAYLIKSSPRVIERKGGQVGLVFTRGNVLISINATSEHLAERFAKHMDDEVKVK